MAKGLTIDTEGLEPPAGSCLSMNRAQRTAVRPTVSTFGAYSLAWRINKISFLALALQMIPEHCQVSR